MASMTMIQALNSALDNMMERDPNVLTFGEESVPKRAPNTSSSARKSWKRPSPRKVSNSPTRA